MNITVTIHVYELQWSVYAPNILLESSVSQNSELGPSFHFIFKKRVTFKDVFPLLMFTFLHFIQYKLRPISSF